MKEFRFHLNPESGQPHIYDHGLDEMEVFEVFAGPTRAFGSRGGTQIVLGQTAGGRILKIVHAPDPDGVGTFVTTAYDLRGKELAAFRRFMRRRFQ